jgi:hypothetical protein
MSHRFQEGGGGRAAAHQTDGANPNEQKKGGCGRLALYVVGGVLGLCLLLCGGTTAYYYIALTPEERAQMKKEREEKEAEERQERIADAEEILASVEEVSKHLPTIEQLHTEGERNCPDDWDYAGVGQPHFAGIGFFEQFASEKFAPRYDLSDSWWFTSKSLAQIQRSLAAAPDPEDWKGLEDMGEDNRNLLESDYFRVFVPEFAQYPTVDGDAAVAGVFEGWQVLVSREDPSQYCFARLLATNSEAIETKGVKVVGVEVDNFKSAVKEDFKKNFAKASRDARLRILSGKAEPNPAAPANDEELLAEEDAPVEP